MTCQLMACPRCHLILPRALLESDPLFVSIVGVPASGKSYFLAAMTWELRRQLPSNFAVAFGDADTVMNRSLNEYEETLFLHNESDNLVAIRKTELQGDLYDQIRLGQQIISLPRPFLFTLSPSTTHPNIRNARTVSRVMSLYDNAGEHFQPGMDSVASPVTEHLAKSRVLMFLFDPTQDPRFRDRCRKFSSDPQLLSGSSRTQRQETVLTEAALRIRRYAGMSPSQKHEKPLLVIVPKADVWAPLLDADLSTEPIISGQYGNARIAAVDLTRIEAVSEKLRQMLLEHAPEFVATAEGFCSHVVYIPCSALGRAPEKNEDTGFIGIRPNDIKPKWVTVPVLYMFAKWSSGLLGGNRPVASASEGDPKRVEPSARSGVGRATD